MTAQPQAAALSNPGKRSHGQIIKSSALIGGSSALNIGIGIVRTKVLALMLGPSGIGLLGLLTSIYELARNVAIMGLNSSGVREIADATGTGDTERIARTVTTLRRMVRLTAILGGLLLVALCVPVAWVSFRDDGHAGSVALLGVAVFLGAVSAGQIALLQGMRRIADLARANVLGALLGTICAVLVVYGFTRTGDGNRGVALALVCVSAMTLLGSWWYTRKIPVTAAVMKWAEVLRAASGLLRLGFVFMATGLMTLGAAWLIRIIVWRKLGEDAAGYYQAAWVLGGLYIGFILQAMGADFFPRLSAVARNNDECNRLVNEQAEVGLLLAGAGVVATLTFAPLVIDLFYSSKFDRAVEILRWICLGMMLRVACWPLGFVLVAKGEAMLFFWSELASNAVQLVLVWFGVRLFGLAGTGMAFFGLYVVYAIGIYMVVRRLSGFRWSVANRQLALVFVPLVGVVFTSWYFLPRVGAAILGSVVTVALGLYSVRALCTLVPWERLPQGVQKVLRLLRLAPSDPQN